MKVYISGLLITASTVNEMSVLGPPGSSQEERRNQKEPEGARRSQEEPGGARRSQEEPGGPPRSQGGQYMAPTVFSVNVLPRTVKQQ